MTCLKLEWASKANCKQRMGRAGRVSNGQVYRLVQKTFYERSLDEYGLPEMSRCPLTQLVSVEYSYRVYSLAIIYTLLIVYILSVYIIYTLCLYYIYSLSILYYILSVYIIYNLCLYCIYSLFILKILKVKKLGQEEPRYILASALDPPHMSEIGKSVLLLKEAGALADPTTPSLYNPFDGQLMFLGEVLASLPLNIELGKVGRLHAVTVLTLVAGGWFGTCVVDFLFSKRQLPSDFKPM